MSITIEFSCNGCEATERVHAKATTEGIFTAAAPEIGGWVRVLKPSIESVTPEDWVAFDPYTRMTYCPTCWADILSETDSPNVKGAGRSRNTQMRVLRSELDTR